MTKHSLITDRSTVIMSEILPLKLSSVYILFNGLREAQAVHIAVTLQYGD